MRTAFLLIALWLAILALALTAAHRAADLTTVIAERDSAHVRFASIPLEEFTSDRANRMSGRVLDGRGQPIAGAEIRVYEWDACIEAAHSALPGEWPSPVPERMARSGADGRYEIAQLRYGAKLVVAAGAGRPCGVISPLSFADGYGAPETDFVLEDRAPLRMRVLDAAGASAAGARLRLLPRAFGIEPSEAICDADGWIVIAPELFVGGAAPRALWGEPPVPIEFSADATELQLPTSAPLRVEVLGAGDGPLQFTLLTAGARRLGSARFTQPAGVSTLSLPATPAGAWEVWVRQGERVGRASIQPGVGQLQLALEEAQTLDLSARSEDGSLLAAEFLWQSAPPRAAPLDDADPFAWLAHFDPTALSVVSDTVRPAQMSVAHGGGWLVAAAKGHALRTLPLEADVPSFIMDLTPAREVGIRVERPFLAVLAEPAGSPPLWGRADAACEVFLLAAPGPLIARSELARGGRSLPRGTLVGDSAAPAIRFSGLDEAGAPSGCVHGFVRDEAGMPKSGVEVWIQGADGQPQQQTTDAQGWFRFEQLNAGLYYGFPRIADPDTMWLERPVLVPLDVHGAGTGRLDLTLPAGIVDLDAAVADLAPGDVVNLHAADGEFLWSCTVSPERRIRLVSVPEGTYKLMRVEPEAELETLLGPIVVPRGGAPVTRFEEPR